MKRYACSLDATARYIPWLIVALAIFIFFTGVSQNGIGNIDFFISVLPVLILAVLVIAMYLLKPLAITMDENMITIERKIRPVVIPLSDVLSVQRVDSMRYIFRTFGNGGVFGYTGIFYKKGIGSMTWYCTQRKNYVLIEKTNGKKIVITPDEPEEFMKDLEAKYPLLVAGTLNPAS